MNRKTLSTVCIVAVAIGVFVCMESLQAQKLKGMSRPAPTKQLMKGILQPNAGSLGAALKDAVQPTTKLGRRRKRQWWF